MIGVNILRGTCKTISLRILCIKVKDISVATNTHPQAFETQVNSNNLILRLHVNLRVFLTCVFLSDGVRAVPEGSGWLHPAERAGLEREGPPPAALYCSLTLPSVPD